MNLAQSPLLRVPKGTANVTPQPLSLPAGVPTPSCWLDARDAGSLFRDSAGTEPAVPNGRVRRWSDRSGRRCHCTLPSATVLGGAMDRVAGVSLVRLTTAGTLAAVPFGAGGFTVVAVWRLRSGDGGHPLGMTVAVLGRTQWCESLGVDVARTVEEPLGALFADGEVCMGLWMRTAAGVVTWRMGALAGATGGGVWTGSLSPENLGREPPGGGGGIPASNLANGYVPRGWGTGTCPGARGPVGVGQRARRGHTGVVADAPVCQMAPQGRPHGTGGRSCRSRSPCGPTRSPPRPSSAASPQRRT